MKRGMKGGPRTQTRREQKGELCTPKTESSLACTAPVLPANALFTSTQGVFVEECVRRIKYLADVSK